MTSESTQERTLLGVRIDALTREELIDRIARAAGNRDRTRVYSVNVHAMNLAASNAQFLRSLNGAELVFCDGYGVKLAAWALGLELPERMTHMDWVDSLFDRMESEGHSLYLLGGEVNVVEACVAVIRQNHPRLRVVGWNHGFFPKVGPESNKVVNAINLASPDVVMVGFGMPVQELWIDANFDALDAPVLMQVGGLFRWYSGVEHRAPRWMSQHGLEWLYRLIRHPLRLFRRYALGNPKFFARVAAARLRRPFS